MGRSAPEITIVSKPNRNPASEATIDESRIDFVFSINGKLYWFSEFFQADSRLHMSIDTTLALPPSENSSKPRLSGDGKIRSVMTASPSPANSSTDDQSTKTCILTRLFLNSSGASSTLTNVESKSTSPERVRSTTSRLL